MENVDVKIRAPTGPAWIACALTFILSGELYSEISKDSVAVIVRWYFTDEELLPYFYGLSACAVISLLYLLSLYIRPGGLFFDMASGSLRRRRYLGLRGRGVAGPFSDWSIRVAYFSQNEKSRGAFKRLEINGPGGFREVLLYTDVRSVDRLLQVLDKVAPQLHDYAVDIEQSARAMGNSKNEN